jgi:hypothetical protein
MARNKPIPRKVRRDLNSLSIREDYNRANQVRRDKDEIKNLSVSVMDHDSAIMYYFNEVIKPTIVDNKETIKVPVMYASPERWYSIQRQGFLRDKRQKVLTPAIVFRRTGIERNENIPVDKLDANKPQNFQTFTQKYSQSNRYDQFSKTLGVAPNKEHFSVVVPDHMILNYEFTIWTSYIEQMNKLVEKINYTDGSYWGEPGKMRFRSRIDAFTDASEMDAAERVIKTTFAVQLMGYILPEEFNSMVTTKRHLTPKKLIFNMDVEKQAEDFVKTDVGGGVSIQTEDTKNIFSISVSNPLIFNAGTGVSLSNDGIPFDGSQRVSQTISIGQDVATTANVTFNQMNAGSLVFGNPTTYSYEGISGSLAITGSVTTTGNMTVGGDATIGGTLVAKEFQTQFVSASILYQSGSTDFGDTLDDTHQFTGSMDISGSFGLDGYSVTGISNDSTLADASPTDLVTEYALKNFTATAVDTEQAYLRKTYFKSSNQILNSSTASFTAVTASAPATMTSTGENDFIFFINGQYMEHDALTIEQSGSSFLLQVDADSIGYSLESDDEIISIGKFNA